MTLRDVKCKNLKSNRSRSDDSDDSCIRLNEDISHYEYLVKIRY